MGTSSACHRFRGRRSYSRIALARTLPEAVLAYLSRYTHRGAISNSRLIAVDEGGVTFRWKDYRAGGTRATRP
jgi:hypothetical protein